MHEVWRAPARNEAVTLLYRGQERAVLHPARAGRSPRVRAADHPAFGMWADRADMRDVDAFVRGLRHERVEDA